MPDQREINAIRQAVAAAYRFDLTAIDEDAKEVKNLPLSNGSVSNGNDIYLNPIRLNSSTPLLPDLEIFNFSDVLEDATIRDRLIEQNLDDAIRYLQHCSALRKEYGETA
jgi:hypothetical protein